MHLDCAFGVHFSRSIFSDRSPSETTLWGYGFMQTSYCSQANQLTLTWYMQLYEKLWGGWWLSLGEIGFTCNVTVVKRITWAGTLYSFLHKAVDQIIA